MFLIIVLGKGGRTASGISLSQFVSKNLAVKNLDDSNPRESILRHAKVGNSTGLSLLNF